MHIVIEEQGSGISEGFGLHGSMPQRGLTGCPIPG